ncbi:helix-turn-helix domain-containing protein [Actinomyces haliotis]|uniref:helix-turn-helix domain-containing protein n=1 Tax=Actinomyces haliotis TaxID=1280843 RepID=UPI00188E3112|nr:helix-turn-helix domain-containing protein [Actinomyces haliotis]
MSPARPAVLKVSNGQREVLRRVASAEATRTKDVVRAQALLLATDGVTNETVARRLGVSPTTTRAWRRAFERTGLASLASAPGDRGRRGTIPGLRLATAAGALSHNEHATVRTPDRQLAVELGVSTATLRRLRADLRIGAGSSPPPHHHMVEVTGVLVSPPVAAVVVALDATTHRTFMRSRRGPHLRGSCAGALVAAMSAADVLRGRIPVRPDERAAEDWNLFMTEVPAQWPAGARLHVVATGPSRLLTVLGPAGRVAGSGLLHVRRTPTASWRHGRLTMIARVLRASDGRGDLAALPELLTSLDEAVSAPTATGSGRSPEAGSFAWVARRELAETGARRSRAELIERTRLF